MLTRTSVRLNHLLRNRTLTIAGSAYKKQSSTCVGDVKRRWVRRNSRFQIPTSPVL